MNEDTDAGRRKAREAEDEKIYAAIRTRALDGDAAGLIAFALLEVAGALGGTVVDAIDGVSCAVAEHD